MPRNWKHAKQEQVQTNGYIPLPAAIREIVETDHPLDGPSVYWNYEQNSHYVVLSEQALQRPNYVDVGRYKIYDAESESRQVRIRPPDRLSEVVRSHFTEGNRVAFLAYEAMAENDNGMVYLLSSGQLLSLLPESDDSAAAATDTADADAEASADGGTSLKQAILKMPGLLPGLL